jgi:serine/threonine-protein kinase
MSDLFRSIQTALADRYQLERELGRGGMATVFLARDLKHPRHVAIKVLRPELAGVMTRGRFLREIRISAELAHPHILPLLDSGTIPPSDDFPALPFYTMPFVEGESLRDRLTREQQLPIDEAIQIAGEVAAALGYAHTHDVVHRDIKPENILLMDGHAVVADFGIARAIKEAVDPEAVTSAGIVIGTPAYMSPEQAAGKADLDGRSDIYSLGCVVYEMLGGEPPFTGASPQAVLARHRMDHAPSLRTLRTSVPDSVEQAVMRALEKSPADRFASAAQFAEALRNPTSTGDSARAGPARTRRRVLIGLTAVLLALLGWRVAESLKFLGDPNKVVVFPLGETPADAAQEGTGAAVAWMIGTALEYTEPLRWIDGQPLLDARQRGDAEAPTAAEARRITQAAGARWYLDGTVVRQGDSATVVLRLNDARGDSVVGRASATRVVPEAAQAGLAAVIQLLPRLLAPGQRMADLAALADRRPAAVALWLQGEREYRSFNFAKALEYAQRALGEDSALAVAAIRGAQAANWLNDMEETSALSGVALRNLPLLPGRMAPFVRGLDAYGTGQADSAVYWLTQAIQASPQWTEAHMALGEVYYHLLPSTEGRLDSLAAIELKAAATDSGLSPVRFHLAELAIRSGDTTRAKEALEDFLRLAQSDASAEERTELELMLGCARGGRKGVEWTKVAAVDPLGVLRAGTMLAGGGAFPGCAEDAFRAVFDIASGSLGDRWGAFLGLQGLLAAEGRTSELRALIDAAIAAGLTLADQLYVLDALAGVGVEQEATAVGALTSRDRSGKAYPFSLWLAGEWGTETGDSAATNAMRDSLAARAAQLNNPAVARFAQALAARMALLRGDTAAAIAGLRPALGAGRREHLDWDLGEPLASDRLLLAELLLARGQLREAISAAAIFDHQAPIVFLPYLPASLELRRRAALALGQKDEARKYESRLAALGRDTQLGSDSPTSTPEGP